MCLLLLRTETQQAMFDAKKKAYNKKVDAMYPSAGSSSLSIAPLQNEVHKCSPMDVILGVTI